MRWRGCSARRHPASACPSRIAAGTFAEGVLIAAMLLADGRTVALGARAVLAEAAQPSARGTQGMRATSSDSASSGVVSP
jgi:hypothetical protein